MGTLFNTLQIEFSNGYGVIGGKNLLVNPDLIQNTNGWSMSTAFTTSMLDTGRKLSIGTNYFYQTIPLISGTQYSARIYVADVSGTVTMTIGNAYNDSSIGTVELGTGWNDVRFVAGDTNVISLSGAGANDYVTSKVIECRECVSLFVTGNITNGVI